MYDLPATPQSCKTCYAMYGIGDVVDLDIPKQPVERLQIEDVKEANATHAAGIVPGQQVKTVVTINTKAEGSPSSRNTK